MLKASIFSVNFILPPRRHIAAKTKNPNKSAALFDLSGRLSSNMEHCSFGVNPSFRRGEAVKKPEGGCAIHLSIPHSGWRRYRIHAPGLY